MRRTRTIILSLAILGFLSLHAQSPKWANKMQKAIFSIITYDESDKIKATGNGFFIHSNGEALSDYSLFKNAHRAVIVTTEGKQFPVTHILGANEIYDILKFRIDVGKEKITTLPLAKTPSVEGENVWLLPYSTQKKSECQMGVIDEVVTAAEKYQYYTLRMSITDKMVSCPITNNRGEVIALVQKPVSDKLSHICYAVDANFAADLSIRALTANNSSLRSIGIKKALPATEDEALVFLYMKAGNEAPSIYLDMLNEFIATYPSNAEGYQRRATHYIENYKDEQHFQMAEEDLKKALELNPKKDEVYHTLCRLILMNINADTTITYKDWGVEKALNTIEQAIAIDSLPLYLQTQGDLHFIMKNYKQAYQAYQAVNRSKLATPESYYAAARSLQMLNDSSNDTVVFSLIDKAVTCYSPPYPAEAAPYIWERAGAREVIGQYREAVLDYNEYYTLLAGRVSANFYYRREQAAIAGRMNQLALDDIAKAIELAPENADYLAEQASLYARFNQVDNAISSCLKALAILPDYADCYRIMAICYAQKGENDKVCEYLKKAKELGDKHCDALIQKYCK